MADTPAKSGTSVPSMTVRWFTSQRTIAWAMVSRTVSTCTSGGVERRTATVLNHGSSRPVGLAGCIVGRAVSTPATGIVPDPVQRVRHRHHRYRNRARSGLALRRDGRRCTLRTVSIGRASDTTVAIVGAGPAGLVAAHLLHRAGIDFVLLERHPRASMEKLAKAGAMEYRTVELLTAVGIAPSLLQFDVTNYCCEFRTPEQSVVFDYGTLTG